MEKPKVLFLCTGNSCRSQMAEGLLRHHAGDRMEVASAGTNAVGLNPSAVAVMQEVGIDISAHASKHVDSLVDKPFTDVVTVCDSARESCPRFPSETSKLHWSLEDPAQAEGSEEERLAVFRRVRDQIDALVEAFMRSRTSEGGERS